MTRKIAIHARPVKYFGMLVEEMTCPGEVHRHARRLRRRNHFVISYGSTWLCNGTHASGGENLKPICEWKERIRGSH
jgi:hypothetical protein